MSVGRGGALGLRLALLQAEQQTDAGSAMRATSVLHALTVSSGLALAKMRVFTFELPGLCGREERAQTAGEIVLVISPSNAGKAFEFVGADLGAAIACFS